MSGFHGHNPKTLRVVGRATSPKKGKRLNPEHSIQVEIVRYLDRALPAEVIFTASSAGIWTGKLQAMKAKTAGQRRGWPDLQLLYPDGVTRYIEVKAEGGRLSPEQRFFLDLANSTSRGVIVTVCRSVEDAHDTLTMWAEHTATTLKAAPLRSPIFTNYTGFENEQL